MRLQPWLRDRFDAAPPVGRDPCLAATGRLTLIAILADVILWRCVQETFIITSVHRCAGLGESGFVQLPGIDTLLTLICRNAGRVAVFEL